MDIPDIVGVVTIICKKIDFNLKSIKRDRKGYFKLITETINQEEVSVLNIYAPNSGSTIYIKEKLVKLKSHIKTHTLIVGDFNTPLF